MGHSWFPMRHMRVYSVFFFLERSKIEMPGHRRRSHSSKMSIEAWRCTRTSWSHSGKVMVGQTFYRARAHTSFPECLVDIERVRISIRFSCFLRLLLNRSCRRHLARLLTLQMDNNERTESEQYIVIYLCICDMRWRASENTREKKIHVDSSWGSD